MIIAAAVTLVGTIATSLLTHVIKEQIYKAYCGYTGSASDSDLSRHLNRDQLKTPDDYGSVYLQAKQVPKLAKRLAAQARTELYLRHRTEAEVIQVREWACRTMRQMNVRSVDQVRILPYILIWAFVETRWERNARLETLTATYVKRDMETQISMWSYEWPSFRHWFGRIHSEPVVSDN